MTLKTMITDFFSIIKDNIKVLWVKITKIMILCFCKVEV